MTITLVVINTFVIVQLESRNEWKKEPDRLNNSGLVLTLSRRFKFKLQSTFSNGHLYKMNTWWWSLMFFSHFTVTMLSLRRTTDAFETVNGHVREWTNERMNERLIAQWENDSTLLQQWSSLSCLVQVKKTLFHCKWVQRKFLNTLYKPDTSLRRTVRAGPKVSVLERVYCTMQVDYLNTNILTYMIIRLTSKWKSFGSSIKTYSVGLELWRVQIYYVSFLYFYFYETVTVVSWYGLVWCFLG